MTSLIKLNLSDCKLRELPQRYVKNGENKQALLKLFYKFVYCYISFDMRIYCVLLCSLSNLTQLQELDMEANKLKSESISVIGDMTSLKTLNLSLCELKYLPQR